jgi:Protein of unknown function (DUF3086)
MLSGWKEVDSIMNVDERNADERPLDERPLDERPLTEPVFSDMPSAQAPDSGGSDDDAPTPLAIAQRQAQAASLARDIDILKTTRDRLEADIAQSQRAVGAMVQDGLRELEQQRKNLQISIEQLERRQERIRAEMRTSFAGSSQEIAIRVQSFKEYLVGSLQDLAQAADQLNLPQVPEPLAPAPRSLRTESTPTPKTPTSPTLGFAQPAFQDQTQQIRGLLDQYRNRPDYYGPPWALRRTFEPIHAERVSNWFFTQGGRGGVRTLGSRLQNVLITSAAMAILRSLYGDRARLLVLAQSPERLGEWRRGLQDCLGITRSDFGPDRGVGLFEDPGPLALKADRLVKEGLMPMIAIDETEEYISLSMLQFPLWLAFAPNPETPPNYSRNPDFW